jgi:uncharacterized linocin/CFP29 family protein
MVTLTEQEYKYVDQVVRRAPLQVLVGRRLAHTLGPLGEGKLTIDAYKIAEVGPAQLFRGERITLSEDIIDKTLASLDIPGIARGFRIPRRSLEASRSSGTPLDVATAASASYQVTILEDTLVLKGASGINGLYDGAGNTTGGADWNTATNIPLSINAAIAELKADKIFPPYNLVVNDAQYDQLFQFIGTTSDYYYDAVQRRIGGQIFGTPVLAAATGMLLAVADAGFFDLPYGIDIHAELEELPLNEFKDLYGVVWESIVPRIHDANAICTLTTI